MPNSIESETLASDHRLATTIGKNTLFGIVANAAQISTRLITVPIVIHHLGIGGYGIWSIILATAAYMRFGSAGIKSAFQKYVAEATGNGNFKSANQLVSTGSITLLALSVLGLVPAAIFSRKMASASGVPPEFLSSAAVSISLLACIYMISNFGAAFEAIVMGGHRIDLTRKYSTVLTVCEAVAIVVSLHLGHGLIAMTLVMGLSELIYIALCFRASKLVVPQMHISLRQFTNKTFPELFRFAGSYQMVNLLEVLYVAITSVVILRLFGAYAAGAFALATRLVNSFLIGQDALALPILSGGTMVFASGSSERIRLFLVKSFKMTLAASIVPLAYLVSFGTTIVFVWTGEDVTDFRAIVWLTAVAALLKSISLVQLILYRASGKVLLDNLRQVLRIIVLISIAFFGRALGFKGVLFGIVGAELIGVAMMFFAMSSTFHAFSGKMFARDAFRLTAAAAMIVVVGMIAGITPIPWSVAARLAATIKLSEATLGCMVAFWPILVLTRSISSAEKSAILGLVPGRRSRLIATE
jgi:O-antigen/teichoic acid export membrane protein